MRRIKIMSSIIPVVFTLIGILKYKGVKDTDYLIHVLVCLILSISLYFMTYYLMKNKE